MSENDIFDELDDRSVAPSFGSGDFADWWEPDDEGEQLVGIVIEQHSEPEDWTDPGEIPQTVHTVMSVGRGDMDTGVCVTPKQHKQLIQGLSSAELLDLIRIEFTGYEKVQGNLMNTYRVGVISHDEWQEMDGSGDIEEMIEEHRQQGGIYGDNRQSDPYREASSDDSSSSSDTSSDDELIEAAEFLKDFVELQNGHTTMEQAEKMMFEVRDYDVDLDAAISMAGLELDDDEISA